MKKIAIYLLLPVIVLIWLIKKASGVTALETDISGIDFKINSYWDFLKKSFSGWNIDISVVFSNYSNSRYKIDNLYIELYSLDGTLIGYQTQPLEAPFYIEPNNNTTVVVPLFFKSNGINKIAGQIKATGVSLADFINQYIENRKFGTEIIISGYVLIKGIKIPIKTKYSV